MDQEVCLNIGAGRTFIPGFANIDISPKAEIQLDIGKQPLPFETDAVDLVFTYHTLEHVDDYLFALGEIHRVLKHGGILLVGVPYVTSTEVNLVNPYHKHNFSENSFHFFDSKRLKGSAQEENSILFEKQFHRFQYMPRFQRVPEPIRRLCRRHLFNVVKKIDFGLRAVKEVDRDLPKIENAKLTLISRFDECLRNRVEYTS